ncbi:hypothetical protein CY35_03G004500 [Sphagnum magellanicum]|nr:hypothetical protein CY35_03G004500 [Sphagnum magellanicum]KAH9566972.1 hypothetical protein CY35_03G004500 [Sphagnum magellanicum]
MAGVVKTAMQRQVSAVAHARHSRDSKCTSYSLSSPQFARARLQSSVHFPLEVECDGLMSPHWSNQQSLGKIGKVPRRKICMTLIEERPFATRSPAIQTTGKALAFELVQGALARWSEVRERAAPAPATAVLLHGILGGRRNWVSFAKRLAQEFPMWQFLLVDLRCHGESSSIWKRGPHSVASAARDVLQLMGQLKLTPRVLIGHSFGGKGGGEDHPGELIASLRQMPEVVPSRRALIETLSSQGFSASVAQWMTTNLKATESPDGSRKLGYSWVFNLEGIADLYHSYEETNLWPMVENVAAGVHIDFLRAERSLHRWSVEDVERIRSAEMVASDEGAGVQMHVLEDAGHWVHTDNPDGLFRVLAPSFGCAGFSNP